jgi:HK97 gp10 family phage protein
MARVKWDTKELEQKMANVIHAATREGAALVASRARSRVKWQSGALATSIRIQPSKFGGHLVVADGGGGGEHYHASFVELGTFKDPAQPFLRPALDDSRHGIEEIYRGKLEG